MKFTVAIFFTLFAVVSAQLGTCEVVKDLEVCSWIDYETTSAIAATKDTVDSVIGKARDAFSGDCAEAYTFYSCAAAFPKCTGDGLPEVVCQDTCKKFLDACSGETIAVTSAICDALPTTDCTSGAVSFTISFASIIVAIASYFF